MFSSRLINKEVNHRSKNMTSTSGYSLRPIGFVRSPLTAVEDAPKQGSEGAPEAWVEIDPAFAEALDGIATGNEVILLTWFHLSRRDLLKVHPRGDPGKPLMGVFATRAPHRPNPIGLHRVQVREIVKPGRLRVWPLEAVEGTPLLDIKPVLSGQVEA
jgi:tRNA-Thr(GGU) m(6)t(6)A37 methyltransferase TsaA